jgi:hypothetical protein
LVFLSCSAEIVAFLLMRGIRLFLTSRFSNVMLDGNALTFVSALA